METAATTPTAQPRPVSGVASHDAVVLIEDDAGDALLVQDLLDLTSDGPPVVWFRSLAEALPHLRQAACVLLDLGLPDAMGLEAVARVRRSAPQAAVVVLTGLDDERRGVDAVAAGAQDYLIKGEVDGRLLARSIRYAIERKRADDDARRLYEAEVRRTENARLERGLLPRPLLDRSELSWASRSRPGRDQALLGGDFYDAVQLADGSVHVLMGDVSGHGPDEAALGVSLRIAWRTLVLAGHPDERVLPALESLLATERLTDEVFATCCTLRIDPDRRHATMHLAGHPPPVLVGPAPTMLHDEGRGLALGMMPESTWDPIAVDLPDAWALLLYTDGIIEGRVGPGPDRLGVEGMLQLIAPLAVPGYEPTLLLSRLLAAAEALHGDALEDDVALVLLGPRQP